MNVDERGWKQMKVDESGWEWMKVDVSWFDWYMSDKGLIYDWYMTDIWLIYDWYMTLERTIVPRTVIFYWWVGLAEQGCFMLSCVKPNSHVKVSKCSWAFSMWVLRYLLLCCQDELTPRLLLPADDRRCLRCHRWSDQRRLHRWSGGVLQLHQSLESARLGS